MHETGPMHEDMGLPGPMHEGMESRAMTMYEGRYSDSHEVATTSIHPSIHPSTTHCPDFAGSVPARPRSRASLFLPRYLFTRLGFTLLLTCSTRSPLTEG